MFEMLEMREAVAARYDDLLKDAQTSRLPAEARSGQPKLRNRLIGSTGEFLIAVGSRLRERYGPLAQYGS